MACLLCRQPLQDIALNDSERHYTFFTQQHSIGDCQCSKGERLRELIFEEIVWCWQRRKSKAFSQSISGESSMHVLTLKDVTSKFWELSPASSSSFWNYSVVSRRCAHARRSPTPFSTAADVIWIWIPNLNDTRAAAAPPYPRAHVLLP